MRFLVSSSPDAATRARPPVRVFLGFVFLLLAAVLAQRGVGGQLTPGGVREAYVPADEALPMVSLVEELHGASFVWGFVLLALGMLLVPAALSARARAWLTWGPAAACALDLAAPFLVVARPEFAGLRAVTGVLAVAALAAAAVAVLWRFGHGTPRA